MQEGSDKKKKKPGGGGKRRLRGEKESDGFFSDEYMISSHYRKGSHNLPQNVSN